jgi:hypothetical protein
MAKQHFSKRAWSAAPTKNRQHSNRTGGDGLRKEQLRRVAKRQTNRTHDTNRRTTGTMRRSGR